MFDDSAKQSSLCSVITKIGSQRLIKIADPRHELVARVFSVAI
jgi:hypothetical protein